MNTQTPRVLVLHPGEMGAAVAERLLANDLSVGWISEQRSAQTIERAKMAGITDFGSMPDALNQVDLVISVCPPHGAVDLANEVCGHGFKGIYLDANAIAPQTSEQIAQIVAQSGARFLDGGIIGPPPSGQRKSRLYLSGPDAKDLAPVLNNGPLTCIALPGDIGSASALKMCFSGWNKARVGLLMNLRTLAAAHGVDNALLSELETMDPDVMRFFDEQKPGGTVMATARKAWRWAPEMMEIASTFEAANLPSGYHQGAAQVFERLSEFKDRSDVPPFDDIAQALRKPN